MAGSAKGITVVAKLLGGKQIRTEAESINESVDSMGANVKASDEKAADSGGGFELFRAKQSKALKDGEKDQKSFLSSTASNFAKYGTLFGSAAVVGGAYESVKKALSIETLDTALKHALKNTGQLHGNVMKQINTTSARTSVHGGFGALEQTEGITRLVTETGSYTTAMKLNNAAMNLARGEHLEYGAALKMVQMGVTGSTGRLQKYLGIITPVKTAINQVKQEEASMSAAQKAANAPARERAELWDKQATAAKVAALTERKFGGSMAAYSKTTAGYISNLKNSFEALEITVGRKLLPPLVKVLRVGVSVISWILRTKVALVGLGTVLGVLMLAYAVEKVLKFAEALKKLTLLTKLQTGVQWLLNAAMDANPILLVVAATAALAAIFYLAYTKVKWFREGVQEVWSWIKGHWPLLAGVLFGPFVFAAIEIVKHWNAILGFFKAIPGKLAAAGRGMWNFVKIEFKAAIDWILNGWNKLHFRMPGVHTPFGTIGGFNIGLPHIPLLGEGGTIRERGSVIVGDRGPEILNLPPGARVDPLTPGSRPHGAAGTWHGSNGSIVVICQIDGREVSRAVVNEIDREYARGNR